MKIHHKYLVLVSLALIFSLLTLNNKMNINAQEPQGKNWMSFIGDQRPLQFISIPGTHDSGALHNLSIKDIFTKRLSSKTVAFLGLAVILVFQYYFFSILGFAYFEFVIFGTIDFALLLYLPYRLIKA